MRMQLLFIAVFFLSHLAFSQWSGSGSTATTPSTEIIINNGSQQSSTLWFTQTYTGPSVPGNYYIKAYDYWGSTVHFQGTGDGGNERMNVTVDGNLALGSNSPGTRLTVSGDQYTNRISQSGGTYTELAQRTWSGSAGILFSAYASDTYVNGGLATTGNTKYKFNATAFGSSGHCAKMIYTNHSSIGFLISPPSTGADQDVSWGTPVMWLKSGGNIGIGTTTPSEKLEVAGTIYSQEVRVDIDAGTGPDYVFEPTYHLRTLEETEAYIKANKHLPEVPSAAEMETNGVQLGEMNMLLLKKIEELTLHLIEVNKQNEELRQELKANSQSQIDREAKQGEFEKKVEELTLYVIELKNENEEQQKEIDELKSE